MILDTNSLLAFFDGDADLQPILSRAARLSLPVIVLGEYRFGLKASRLKKEREKVLTEFITHCEILPVLPSTTVHYAVLRHALRQAGTPIPENDVWIAALALEHALPVLTRDRHFDAVAGIKRIEW